MSDRESERENLKKLLTGPKGQAFAEAMFSSIKDQEKVEKMSNEMLANLLWQYQSNNVPCMSLAYEVMDEICRRLDPTLRNGFDNQPSQ